jgi:hypothetical protein
MSRRWAAFVVVALAGFASAPARAEGEGPVIVIPSRPGVPVVINGRDASYAVVEGDWGLSRPGAGIVTVIGGSPIMPNEVYRRRNSYIPKYGRAPGRGRNEVEPAADRALPDPAESFSRSWSTSSETDTPVPATITDPATFPNNMNGINGALINNNSNNRNSGNTNTNSNNSQSTNYNNSNINNTNTNSNNTSSNSTTNNTNSNNTSNTNTNSNNTSNTNSNNNSSRNTIGSNNSSRRYHHH